MADFVVDFVEEIKEEMNNQGMSKIQLAKKLGVNRLTVLRFLNHYKGITDKNIERFSKALGMKPVLCLMEEEE